MFENCIIEEKSSEHARWIILCTYLGIYLGHIILYYSHLFRRGFYSLACKFLPFLFYLLVPTHKIYYTFYYNDIMYIIKIYYSAAAAGHTLLYTRMQIRIVHGRHVVAVPA